MERCMHHLNSDDDFAGCRKVASGLQPFDRVLKLEDLCDLRTQRVLSHKGGQVFEHLLVASTKLAVHYLQSANFDHRWKVRTLT